LQRYYCQEDVLVSGGFSTKHTVIFLRRKVALKEHSLGAAGRDMSRNAGNNENNKSNKGSPRPLPKKKESGEN